MHGGPGLSVLFVACTLMGSQRFIMAIYAPWSLSTRLKRRRLRPVLVEISCHCFFTHPDFGNSAEEFHPHETLSTLIKLLSSLSSLIWCHISIINVHKTLMNPIETGLMNRGSTREH
jgi:hypothetical protein